MAETYDSGRGVYLLLESDDSLLFLHRNGVAYLDNMHMVPGGRIDKNEQPTIAVARETIEEVGVIVDPKDIVFAHFMYRKAHDESGDRVDIFFKTSKWDGDPRICEPDKCDRIDWFQRDSLPESVPEYVKEAIRLSELGITYSEYDW